MKWNKSSKVWNSVNSLSKWRFLSRCRRDCLSLLIFHPLRRSHGQLFRLISIVNIGPSVTYRSNYFLQFLNQCYMVFCLFPWPPVLNICAHSSSSSKLSLTRALRMGWKQCSGYKANKIQCMIQCQRKFFVKYSYERRSNSKDLY